MQPSHSQWNAKDVRGRVRYKSDIDLIIVKKIAIFFIPLDPISQYHSSGPIARPQHGIPQASSRRRRERHDNALLHVDPQSDVPPQDQPARIIKFVIKNSGLNSSLRRSYIMTMHEESATHANGNPDAERNDHDCISGNVHCPSLKKPRSIHPSPTRSNLDAIRAARAATADRRWTSGSGRSSSPPVRGRGSRARERSA